MSYVIVNDSNDFSEEPKSKRHKSLSSGLDVGLHSSEKVRQDLERVKKGEKDSANKMDSSLSSRGATIIYRDNVGTYAFKMFIKY